MMSACSVLPAAERLDLNVAVFAYTPEAAFAIEQFEEAFEEANPTIDLDLVLWNPYDNSWKDDRGMEKIKEFDVAEIDVCRLTELVAGEFGGLDEIPKSCRLAPEVFIGPARELVESTLGSYVLPHWSCGNFLFSWKGAHPNGIQSFSALKAATAAQDSNPLLATLWGKSGLGYFYFDCLIDTVGEAEAQKHLLALFDKETVAEGDLNAAAVASIRELSDRLPTNVRRHLEHYYNHSYVLPRWFADKPASVMVGFSERLYFTEREKQLEPGKDAPVVTPEEINVEEVPLGAKSEGMPAWVDAFVIPKGKLAPKRDAIEKFLVFAASKEGFMPFIEPQMYLAPTYLLPSVKAIYELPDSVKKQPLLPLFMHELERATPIADHRVWQGMRKVGKVLQTVLSQP